MPSHCLLSAQTHATFRALRWHETSGDPICPHCGCCAAYECRTRRLFKCKGCMKQFSVTTFHGRKLSIRDYLMAIAIFANAAKGISALQLGRDLDVSYKTAFVLAHKPHEAHVVVIMCERQGRSLPFVVRAEDEGVATVARRVQPEDRRAR